MREAFSLPSGSTQSRGVGVRGAVGTTRVSLGCLVNKVTLAMRFCFIFVRFDKPQDCHHLFSKLSVLNKKSLSGTSVYPVIYVPYPHWEP